MTGANDPDVGKAVAFQTLRKRAEAKVFAGNKSFNDMSASEMSTLIHELRIHQVELEMQNEELRKSQAETERSRKAYQDLWELSPVGYLIVDFAGRVTAVNRTGQRLFGRPENALLKERFSMLVTPENQVPVHLMFERAVETGIAEKQEIRILKPDGSIHICLLEVRSLGGEPGREQIQAVLTDITQQKRADDDLKKNEQEKIAILDSLVEHVVYQDREMKILWANRAACESVHMKREDLLGQYCHEIWADRQSPCEDCPVRKAHDTKQPQQVEKMTPDGRWWYIQGHPVRDHNGHVMGTTEITLDITDRKRAEETIRQAKDELEIKVEERTAELVEANTKLRQEINDRKRAEKDLHEAKNLLSNTFNALQDLVVVIDQDLRVRLSNWKDHDYISEINRQGHPFCYEVFMNRKKPCSPCHVMEVFATGEIKQLEDTYPIDGKIREIRVLPIFDDKGKVVAVIEHLRDITESKRAEDRLRESEERYRHLVESARDIIYTLSLDATIISVNPAIENITGWFTNECIGKHIKSLVHPDDWPLALAMGQRALQAQKPPIHEVRILAKSGEYITAEFSITPLIQKGAMIGILGVGRDITIRKKLEEALNQQTYKLAERVKELNCFFGISKLFENPGRSLHEILQGIVDLIPPAWQYPEITCAKIVLNDQKYTTKNFKDTIWKLSCNINVHGDIVGTLNVCYLEEKPLRDEGPFLKDEKRLLKIIGERLREIVERKQTQKARLESEFRYHGLFNHMTNGVAVYQVVNDGEDFIFVDFNKAAERIDNVKREDLIGKSLLKMYPGVKEFGLFNVLQRVWRTAKPEPHPVTFYKDGRIRGWRENFVFKLPSGELMTVYEDITHRKQVEEALRESQQRFKSIFENAHIGFYRTTPDGRILDANPALIQMLGYDSFKELAAVNLETDDYHPEYPRRQFRESIERDGEIKGMEAFWKQLDGTLVYIRENARAIRDADGNIIYYEGTMEDITDQRQAEQHVRSLSQQLIQAQESERQMISRELHDRVAQDLSSLMIGLNTLSDHQPNVTPEVRKKALEFSEIIKETIRAVRNLSYELRLPGLDNMGLIPALSMYCEEFAEKSGLKVDFQATGMSALRLDFDTEMNLYRLIQEGLNNIRKHAVASQATIKLIGSYPNIVLRIEDDGKGFDVQERARTADKDRRMGLRSMQERVSLMRGKMRIQSQPMKGTHIFIKFLYQEKKHGSKENHIDR